MGLKCCEWMMKRGRIKGLSVTREKNPQWLRISFNIQMLFLILS
jgi:hypothetical protein